VPVADIDPAFEQQVLDISQAQREPRVHYHNRADDLGRRVGIAERGGGFPEVWASPSTTLTRPLFIQVQML
jgi:hypothetical protein